MDRAGACTSCMHRLLGATFIATPRACSSPGTPMLILPDARTGEFVLALSPALP